MAITVWLNTDHQNDLLEFPTATGAEVNPAGILRLYRARADAVDVQLGSFAPGVWKYYTQVDPGDPAPEEPPVEEPSA